MIMNEIKYRKYCILYLVRDRVTVFTFQRQRDDGRTGSNWPAGIIDCRNSERLPLRLLPWISNPYNALRLGATSALVHWSWGMTQLRKRYARTLCFAENFLNLCIAR